jgi:DNA-binding NarL/FixJ family response regulator
MINLRAASLFSRQMAKKINEATPVRRVFIVEDHPVFRQGLIQMLDGEPDLTVVGYAAEVASALRAIAKQQPDLVLVDIGLPGKSGLDLIKEIRGSNRVIKLLLVSMHDEALYADRVLRAGGDGYVMKQQDSEEIIHAIRDVLAGHIYVSEEVMARVTKGSGRRTIATQGLKLGELTDDELEILELLGRGKSEPEIARQLRVGVAAIAACCKRIQKKLKLKTPNTLVRHAVCWVEEAE